MSGIVGVEFIYLPVINFAMQQNRVSVIRRLAIENLTDDALQEVKIELSATPAFGTVNATFVEVIPAKKTVQADAITIQLSPEYFAQLTERFSGQITLEVFVKSASAFKQSYPIDVLAYDQWGGTTVLPEMLSAFITPNHPSLVFILKRAGEILEEWTGNPSLDEYQSRNPDRVRKQMAAIYLAIFELDIMYSTVPASFEAHGQRIRLPDVVLSQRLGTCLDMALLYASCLEAAGIHSIIVVVAGHAFAAGWLVPETFPDAVIDDVSLLTKRTADGINDIVLVETTCMNTGSMADFDGAAEAAGSKLIQHEFVLALDVKRARFAGIRPIPQRVLNGNHWIIEGEKASEDKSFLAPQRINPYDLSWISAEIHVTKQLLWERKLLDLSLRNNLLNIRITKNTLQLISVNLSLLEDALANGEEFRILHKPTDWDNPLYAFGIYQNVAKTDPVIKLVESELTQKRLRSYLTENELGDALTHLYRSSRTSMEENGANTLYLALGLLKWYETNAGERPRYAPILLVPVEIIRKSAAKGYVIRSREEDAMVNITLLEMLRQNFNINISGLSTLPMDANGLDVNLIYSIVRNSIKNQPRWDVEEQAILGIFSFSKFIMWNDIHNNSHKLAENKIVSSLISGRIEWDADVEMADAAELDKYLSPADLMLPISADSSQLEAIFEAGNDKSFILHGPPGTGKSQTITNLIANALYHGKRVLFVAEKMAALTVVQKRLNAIGLSPFCLEIHSNKVKKSAILSQLKETMEVVRHLPPENFKREAERLHKQRLEQNKYVEALHRVHSFGWSLYEAITRYEHLDVEAEFNIPQSYVLQLKEEQILQWQEALEALVSMANACGHPHNHPLTGITITAYSAGMKEEAAANIGDIINLLSELKPKLQPLATLFGAETFSCRSHVSALSEISRKILHIPELTPVLLTLPKLNEKLEECMEICVHGKERDRIKQQVTARFSDGVFSIDAKMALAAWNRASVKWFLPKFFEQRKISRQLKGFAYDKVVKEQIPNILSDIIRYQDEKTFVHENAGDFPALFGKSARKGSEHWLQIETIINDLLVINALITEITKDIAGAASFKERLAVHLSDGIGSFKRAYGDALTDLIRLTVALEEKEFVLSETLGVSKEALYGRVGQAEAWIDEGLQRLNAWKNHIGKLKDWYQWLLVRNQLESLKIGFVADAYKNRHLDTSKVTDMFNKSLYKAIILHIISNEPILELFKGKIFTDVIEKYKRLNAAFEVLIRKEIVARLASALPSFTHEATQSSEVGILKRNIKNNARGISIRKLFDQIPTLLSRMCPCMLMSPISVAQYIDPDAEKFDLIVFDEASQMPTCEAVGAIARGKNVVVVGDPKQMPPTSFFSTHSVDEEHIDIEDLESILDDCLALSMPSKHLLWHYRSKHESLIAFSNSEYYDNKLLTFPSPDNIESKVRFVPVEGSYDKGKSRQNKAEAQAVVNEIVRRLRDDELRRKSIGVVTFSIVQQTLIDDLLSDLFVENPDLEALALECEEPLFIKNLENVQGDERDVILFSVGYGPDKEGKVSMNFGPLNRTGGERRLNVAVSRARYEMVIYSTMRSEQIDLNRTSSIGVAGLKRFLEYAEKGSRMTFEKPTSVAPDLSLHAAIAAGLRKLGHVVHTDIGCSGYKIDIGIVDDENPSKYKLGIICDGENYKRTKTVRDREIVQNSVLKMLGWNICRVWTLDWWENPSEVIASIQHAIHNAGIGKETSDLSAGDTYAESASESEPADDAFAEFKSEATGEEWMKGKRIKYPNRRDYIWPGSAFPALETEVVEPAFRAPEIEEINGYVPTTLRMVVKSSDVFYDNENKDLILKQIIKVMRAEAPISRSLLYKRILTAWSISRLTTKTESYLDTLISKCVYFNVHHEHQVFYWLDEEQYRQYNRYRTGSGRDASDIPPEEIANGALQILRDEISIPAPDLSKACARRFGFLRSGSSMDAAMMRGIELAIRKGYFKIENGRAIIV